MLWKTIIIIAAIKKNLDSGSQTEIKRKKNICFDVMRPTTLEAINKLNQTEFKGSKKLI